MTYGLIGKQLDYSFSRKYFTEKFRLHNLSHRYLNFELTQVSEYPSLVQLHADLAGCNVTIPYKQAIIPYLSDLDPTARSVGAVNTIVFSSKKHTATLVSRAGSQITSIGYNTDVIGFAKALSLLLQGQRPTHSYILGTGGAAQAVSWVLAKAEHAHTFVSRNPSATQLGYQRLQEVIAPGSLIVNTTPLGTSPHVDAMPPVSESVLRAAGFVFDLIYNPAETLLLRKARAAGCRTLNGLPMLEEQAEASWRLWNANAVDLHD